MANYNGGDNLVARYARLLIQSGKTHGEYNQKRNEIKNLLDAPVGAAIHFNLGFQAVNVEDGVNLNEVRDNIYAMIQMVRHFPAEIPGAKNAIDQTFGEVWDAQEGRSRRRRRHRKAATRRRKARKARKTRRN